MILTGLFAFLPSFSLESVPGGSEGGNRYDVMAFITLPCLLVRGAV